jgi:hypothetical protein
MRTFCGAVGNVVDPASVTVTVCPETLSVAVRDDAPVLAATLYLTVPFPLPLAPDVIVIHDAPLEADQLQPLPAVTVTLAVPPAEVNDCDVGEIVMVQGADWVIVTVRPATVRVPVRDAVPAFDDTR